MVEICSEEEEEEKEKGTKEERVKSRVRRAAVPSYRDPG